MGSGRSITAARTWAFRSTGAACRTAFLRVTGTTRASILRSGGTFDQFADDVRAYPVELRGDRIWIDIAPRGDEHAHNVKRLRDGLERSIRLVIAKSAIALLDGSDDARAPFRAGLEYGSH